MGNNKFNFQNLEVYRRSKELSVVIISVASNFPLKYKRITDQLIGAIISISLNVAEGSGRYNAKEKKQFYRIARASSFEVVAIIDICLELKLIQSHDEWENELYEISQMLSGLIRSCG